MKILGQILCVFLLAFTFSCDSDAGFDNENPDAKIQGEWDVISVESKSYSSTMTSPTGQMETSQGSFSGTDLNMSLIFDPNSSFRTIGDYNQILSIEGSFPTPIVIESRYNDFAGGGSWEVSNNTLRIKTPLDEDFQTATLNVFTDTEMEFDYKYSRSITEGTVERIIETEVSYVLEKK